MNHNSLIKILNGTATLCCGKANCPTINISDGNINITDDFNGSVKIPIDQAKLIGESIDQLLELKIKNPEN